MEPARGKTPSDGAEERAPLDQLDDLRRAQRGARLRGVRTGVLLAVPVLITFLLFVGMTMDVAAGAQDPGWIPFSAAVFAAACLWAGRSSAVLLEAAATRRAGVVALERRRRDLVLDSADDPGAGRDRLERALLDDLDDARASRRGIRRQAAGYGAVLVAGAVGTADALARSHLATSSGTCLLLGAGVGTLVSGLAGYLSVTGRGRREATQANLRRAERRHREVALYDVADGLPDPALSPVPSVRARKGLFWIVPVVAVGASLVVSAPPAAPVPAGAAPPGPPPLTLTATALPDIPTDYAAGIAVSPDGHRAYVANQGPTDHPDDTVSVIDLDTDGVVGVVHVGSGPTMLALAPDGRRLYVAAIGTTATPGRTVSVVDTTTSTVVATVPLDATPAGVAVSPDGRAVWVTTRATDDGKPGAVVLVDPRTDTVAATVRVGGDPYRVAVSPDGTRVYVANFADNTVSVLDAATRRVTATVPVGPGPYGMAVDPTGRTLWVVDQNAPDPRRVLTAVDTGALTATTVDLGPVAAGVGVPTSVALTPDGRRLLVGRDVSGVDPRPSVAVVDPATRTVVDVLDTPGPFALAAAPDGHHVYATAGDIWEITVP